MSFQGKYSGATTLKTAALMLATMPPMIVFLIFRNQIQSGLVDGALKRQENNMSIGIQYQSTWESIKQHTTPSWFKKAKYGIYAHWGPYSVPAAGPNVTWYPYWMYREPSPQFDHHVKHFGHPSKFGYKDFIPMFTAEKFDAEEWADLYSRSGAKFAGPVAEHHDGFPMWDCSDTEWCASKMGPKRDVVGELEKAIRDKGMKYMVAMHHAENWYFFPHWNKDFDTSKKEYEGLYGELLNLDNSGNQAIYPDHWGRKTESQDKPSKAFHDRWLNSCLLYTSPSPRDRG